MKSIYIFISILFILISTVLPQSISFYPANDTLYMGGGGTPPEVELALSHGTAGDSLLIRPEWNTIFWTIDSSGNQYPVPKAFFLITDSTRLYHYQIKLCPIIPNLPARPLAIDTTHVIESVLFRLELSLFYHNTLVDSLSRVMNSGYGLATDQESKHPAGSKINLRNYPNPFNPETILEIDLSAPETVRMEIFNILGQKVYTFPTRSLPPGTHRIRWNSRTEFAMKLISGIYLCRIRTETAQLTKQIILAK